MSADIRTAHKPTALLQRESVGSRRKARLEAIVRAYVLPAFSSGSDLAGGGARFTRLRAVMSAEGKSLAYPAAGMTAFGELQTVAAPASSEPMCCANRRPLTRPSGTLSPGGEGNRGGIADVSRRLHAH